MKIYGGKIMNRTKKMENRKAAGKTYTYQPILYEKDSNEYRREKRRRAEKKQNHKLPLAQWTSFMKKVENQMLNDLNEEKKKWKTGKTNAKEER